MESPGPGAPMDLKSTVPRGHPRDPRSNVAKFGGYDPDKYVLCPVSPAVATFEALLPNRSPKLTQRSIGMYLRPTTRELDEVPPLPTIDELQEAVINRMVAKDKAFWVDKPGSNAYTLHEAFEKYNMGSVIVKPNPQAVFPRSYQYDLDCVNYRRTRACEGLTHQEGEGTKQPIGAHCRDCADPRVALLKTPFEVDAYQKRWRYYPDVSTPLSQEEIQRSMMFEVGRPFRNEACNFYNKNFPSEKYDTIVRKFS